MSDRETRKANVVEALNKARSMELHAIHQYMNQHYNLDDMDYGELAANMKLIAIDEMRHCEMFAERIKELGGEPTSEVAGKVVKGQEVKAIYSSDSDSEDDTIFVYNELRKVCVDNGDILTAKLFETIIGEEQIHLNYFDNISDHIETLGDTFLSKIAGTPSSTGGPPRALPSLPQPRTRADTLEKLETPGKGAFFSKVPFPKTVSAAGVPPFPKTFDVIESVLAGFSGTDCLPCRPGNECRPLEWLLVHSARKNGFASGCAACGTAFCLDTVRAFSARGAIFLR